MNFKITWRNLVIITAIILIDIGTIFCTRVNEVDYAFNYEVEAPMVGVITHHWEKRLGKNVRGGYSLLDPDGKVRVVEYHVEGKRGFKAYVTFRNPPGQFKGHLQFPKQYRTPIRLAEPVSLITPDLFQVKDVYPNLPR